MKLDDIMDRRELDRLVAEHYISERSHPTLPLEIYNYTAKAQYERLWTPETVVCRGLIVHAETKEIVAKGFTKFFNLGEIVGQVAPDEPFTAYEKLDGSLGIAYIHDDGLPSLATRGSFTSFQARVGTAILRTTYRAALPKLAERIRDGFTFCFEIISAENRIVVDYGNREDLVLLAVFETETGQEVDPYTFPSPSYGHPFPHPKHWSYTGLAGLLEAVDEVEGPLFDGQEGVVVRFASGLRLKIKRSEYVRLHRIGTGITPRRIWDMLRSGDSVARVFAGTSEGFQKWASEIIVSLTCERLRIAQEAVADHVAIRATNPANRKEFATLATKARHPSLLFRMYDEKSIDDLIWKQIKPGAADPFRVEE